MSGSWQASSMGFAARRYTPADFADPPRRPSIVRWGTRAVDLTTDVVRDAVDRVLHRPLAVARHRR